jgi:hypothetical protein
MKNRVPTFEEFVNENEVNEIKANTSKLFNWWWGDDSSAKEQVKKTKELTDEQLLQLLDSDWTKSCGPQKIQYELLKKEKEHRKI